MVRARHPLTLLGVLISFLASTLLFAYLERHERSWRAVERWRSNAEFVAQFDLVLFVGVWIVAVAGLVVGGMQLAIRLGWSPRWLERVELGATVIERFEERNGTGWIELLHGDRSSDRYRCSAKELADLKLGDFGHFRVIGGELTGYRLVPSSDADLAAATPHLADDVRRIRRLFSPMASLGTRATLAGMTLFAGWPMAQGLTMLATREVAWGSDVTFVANSRTGPIAVALGCVAIVFALGMFAFSLAAWIHGVQDGDFDSDG